MAITESLSNCSSSDTGPVIPTTPLVTFLERVQEAALKTFNETNFDPKLYVDLSLKLDLSTTEKAFDELRKSGNGSLSVEGLKGFIEKYFEGAGNDMVYIEPVDFVPEPEGFLPKVENPEVRAWALEVHALWKNLSRKVSDEVHKRPELNTILPLPEQVMIPGSRFREVYYWDSYWVIRSCNGVAHLAAKSALESRISCFFNKDNLPPALSACCKGRIVFNSGRLWTSSETFLLKFFHRACTSKAQALTSGFSTFGKNPSGSGTKSTGSMYTMSFPAPSKYFSINPFNPSTDKDPFPDFRSSSKAFSVVLRAASWTRSRKVTKGVVGITGPVSEELQFDKDSVIAIVVVSCHGIIYRKALWALYYDLSVNCILKRGGWWCWWRFFDGKETFASCTTFFFNLVVYDYIELNNRDFPNGWAPLQHMIVEGLGRSESKKARSVAEDIAVRWIRTNYVGYKKTGAMHEKYDVEKCGEFGGGGEYVPQTGFGWSNGVVLAFLEEFGWPQDRKIGC
ncbi:uncharacterized protein LOC111986510 [Quercus suber]